ncbi:MAG: TonB-dependent receptor [Pseudomonadota bacterium]
MRTSLNFKHSLLLGTSIATFAWAATPALAQNNNNNGNETVIVTGTRVQGMTAADSAAPITVLGSDSLTRGAGSGDLRAALGQTVPSFVADSFGGDTANLTLSAALRGLSPNDTLVLVNGKRRHGTGNLNVNGGSSGGGAAADISLIPTAAIDHVEVLLDGAAAQYGTDAIAGVVNFILKKKSAGGQLQVSGGQNYNARGDTYNVSFNIGLPLFDKGYVNLTVDKKFHAFTHNGGNDTRLFGPTGIEAQEGTIGVGGTPTTRTAVANAAGVVPCTAGICVPLANRQAMPEYGRANLINSDPEYQLFSSFANAGYDFSDDVQLYAFGSWAHRFAKGMENVRMPSQVIAAPGSNQPCSAANPQGYNTAVRADLVTPACAIGVSTTGAPSGAGVQPLGNNGLFANGTVISTGQAGTFYTPGELVLYPNGFSPQEVLREDDYQYNMGMKFNVAGWDLDANVGYGKDIDSIYTWRSANRTLFIDTHTTPTDFYDGTFTASEFVGTLDATHPFNVGMASPLTVAVGVEARENFYSIDQGDAASRYKEGGQSYPGFQPTDAGKHSRKNYGVYLDFALAPIEALQLDVAGRAEHYSDFGDAQIGKITARYDFNPQIAIRGTISTGFRAPNLGEEFYSATQVSPIAATVQLPANSAAAKVLGLPNLKPEISTQYSVGIVAHPFEDLSVTLDAYSVTLGDRIVRSGTVNSLGGAVNSALVNVAIAAHGNILDPTATQNGVTAFLNGLDTLTQGVDLTVNYPTDFGDMGLIDWTLAGNYNSTALSSVLPPPAVLVASNPAATFFQPYTLFNFVHSAPQEKVGLTANWSLDEFGVTFRETYYGPQKQLTTPNGGLPYYNASQAGVGLTDIEARYNVTEGFQVSFGGNNVFNIRRDVVGFTTTPLNANGGTNSASGGSVQNAPVGAAFDPNGGYYYGRVTLNF